MVRKKLAMAVLALSALQADLASALGLGNLSVRSALNQPLNAEIKLLDTGDLDPSQIKVQLATPEDFERAGVDRNFFLTNLKFAVDIDGRGTGTIRITTHDAVVEPYLNFVVEAKWPNGRLLREFAVLLDPPTFSGGAAQPAPRAAAPAPRASAAPTRELEPPKVTTAPAPSTADRIESNTMPESASATEHRVQVGDTLSKIAAQHKPSDATVQQTMVAIQRANPDAFINSNINLIKSGSVLRLPTADDARAVGASDAAQQIASQTHAWRSGGAGETASGPQLDASQSQSADAAAPQDGERLTIATPGNSDKSTTGEGSAKASKSLEALRNQLSASQESLDGAKRDNQELQSRLDDMERQMATLKRLVSLKDDQLAALQAKSAEQGKAAAPAQPAPAPAQPEASAPQQAPAAEQPAPAATEPAATPPAAVAPPPVAAKPAPAKPVAKAPKPAPEPTFIEKFTSEPLYWGGALAALALILGGAAFAAKKRREEEEAESAYQELDLEDYTAEPETPDVDLDTAAISDEAVVPAVAVAAVEPEKKPLRSETGDAIAEADIYIAYGRYQQAVDLLTSAIDAEPERTDLRVKLLEVYLEMRNRDAFRQQFMALQSLGDSSAIGQVKEMLSSVEGVSDWLNDLPQPASASSATSYAVAAGVAAAAAAVIAHDDKADDETAEGDFDLDLDLDDELPADSAAPQAASELPAEPLEDLELDLDLDEELGDIDLPGDDEPAVSDVSGFQPAAPAFDPFAGSTSAAGDESELELDLDEDELDLELNEDDLDFALRAMEGDQPAEASAPEAAFDAPEFEVPDFDSPVSESPNFDAPSFDTPSFQNDNFAAPAFEPQNFDTQNVQSQGFDVPDFDAPLESPAFEPVADNADFAAPSFEAPAESTDSFSLDNLDSFEASVADLESDDNLKDFDLSLTDEAVSTDFVSPETSKLEEDLGDLSELEDLNLDFGKADEPVDFAAPLSEPAAVPELTSAVGDDFDFLADTDEVATKLDLARAYIDMGDTDGAKDILDEVLSEGSDVQKQEASELLGRIA